MPKHRLRVPIPRLRVLQLCHALMCQAANVMMCRGTVGVRWDGALFDCDFNLALELPHLGSAKTLFELDSFDSLTDKPIATGPHCYGCTAGAGSS